LASRRHRRSVGGPRQRADQGAQLLVRHRLRGCCAARQRRGPDREQHRLWTGDVVDRAHHRQKRRGRAVELLRLPGAGQEGGAADARRGDRDRQPSHRCRTNGDAADRPGDLERGDAADRRAFAPHAVHAGAGQGGAGLDVSHMLAARRADHRRVLFARVQHPDRDQGGATMQRRVSIHRPLGMIACALAGWMILTPTASAQSPKLGDPPEAKNMRLVGYSDLQGRSAYQPTIHHQGSRYIAYVGHHGGTPDVPQPINRLTGQAEYNGTSIVDVTDPREPKYLAHIPGLKGNYEEGGAQMVRVCDGKTLPKGDPSETYMLRVLGGQAHEIWDVTDPAKPALVTKVVEGLKD